MAAQCPLCHAPVNDDFGLQECNGCGAQLLVHMDGHVEYKGADQVELIDEENEVKTVARAAAGEQSFPSLPEPQYDLNEEPPPPPAAPPEEPPEDLVPPQPSQARYQMPEEEVKPQERPEPDHFIVGETHDETERHTPAEVPDDATMQMDTSDDSEAEVVDEPVHEPTTFDFDSPPGHVEAEAAPPPPVYVSASSPSSPDLSDVAAFGNSEMSGGRDGTLRYNLIIEGIDTADVREAFREAITDKKFVWDIDQILKSVRNGKVLIPNVAPTKGYILVTRLRNLPLKIRWEQYAIQQT